MTPGEVIIHRVYPHCMDPGSAAVCLTEEEKSRAERFHFAKDSIHWANCRASLRQILGRQIGLPPSEVPLVFAEFGKPLLAAPFDWLHFNLSHCPDLAVVALCLDGPVGIDLEAFERASGLLDCETSFCHPEEIRTLPADAAARAAQLLRIWTAKEAVLKSLGTGLSHPPEDVRILFGPSNAVAKSDSGLQGIGKLCIQSIGRWIPVSYCGFVSYGDAVGSVRQESTMSQNIKNL